jgi:hypothetical protein
MLQHVRHPQAAQVCGLLAAMDAADDPMTVISLLLRVGGGERGPALSAEGWDAQRGGWGRAGGSRQREAPRPRAQARK